MPSERLEPEFGKKSLPPRFQRARRIAVIVTAMLAVLAVGWWAGRVTLLEAGTQSPTSEQATVKVIESTVQRTISVSVTSELPKSVVAVNLLAGVVTRVTAPGTVDVGVELYAVAGQSVRAVTGSVPFYRDLTFGVVGDDVQELEGALHSLGYLAITPDTKFDSATRTAVRAWQKATGSPVTGTVALGQVVAIPTLPTSFALGNDVTLGALLNGGEDAVLASSGAREFSVVLSSDQEDLIPTDSTFEVTIDEQDLPAVVSRQSVDESGHLVLQLVAPDGGAVCASSCEALPDGERLNLRGKAIIVPETRGPSLPAAAIRTDDEGKAYVRTEDGVKVIVEVLASTGGIAIVGGIDVGETILLPDGS